MRSLLPITAVSCVAGAFAAVAFDPPAVETFLQPKARASDEVEHSEPAAELESAAPRAPEVRPVVTPITDSVLFEAPPVAPPLPELPAGAPQAWPKARTTSADAQVASAYAFIARVYERPYPGASSLAIVRRGGLLNVEDKVRGHGCRGGQWYRVAPEGYVCSRRGFHIQESTERRGYVSDVPDTSRARPFLYGKLVDQGAPLLKEVPSVEAWEQVQAERRVREADPRHRPDYPDVVRRELHGAYFFALASREERHGKRWLHTLRGRVLPADAVERMPATRMRGEFLRGGQPVAFVVADAAPVRSAQTGEPIGTAERYARFRIQGERTVEGKRFVRVEGGYLVARQHVRRVRPVAQPDRVPAGARWIHVDLGEQVVVAYQGDLPVFASLIASGIEGHETPTGLFRVGEKHVSTTMRGPDPDMGIYEVQEVPWTMFFSGDYALHGAYWHDAFGAVRSHGCVNVTPGDARWLFHWTAPERPEAWHSMRGLQGAHVYVTR